MIGWRGASRYYSESYREAFGLECKAIAQVREKMGLSNVAVMIPFCRTVEELMKVTADYVGTWFGKRESRFAIISHG